MSSNENTSPPHLDFTHIADNSMMAILVYRQDSMEPIYMNKLAEETLEVSESPALPNLLIERLYPEEGSSSGRCFNRDFVYDAGFYQDIMMKRLNGTNFIANLGIREIQNGKYIVLMFQDVTFQKKLQREVQVKQQELMRSYTEILEQNAELQTLSQAKDKLITLSSHELRTPLSAIIAMSESLSLGIIDEPDELKSYHNEIHKEGKNLMSILNSMLEVLKLTTGKMPFFVNINDLVKFSKEKISEKINSSHPGFKVTYTGTESVKGYIDTIHFKNALLYVVDNAVKHCPDCNELNIHFEEKDDLVLLRVSDLGPGIDIDYQESIFQEFTTLAAIDTHSKGAGLSLTIAKLSTEQQGGKLYVNPEYKKGAEFVFEIPKNKVLNHERYSDFNPYEEIEI